MSYDDNDLKRLGELTKELREHRSEKFEDAWLPKFREKCDIVIDGHKYVFNMPSGLIVDFYPKANKLLIRKDNKWIKPGLKWLIKKLL